MGNQGMRTPHISEATKKKTQQKYQALTKHVCLKQIQVSPVPICLKYVHLASFQLGGGLGGGNRPISIFL